MFNFNKNKNKLLKINSNNSMIKIILIVRIRIILKKMILNYKEIKKRKSHCTKKINLNAKPCFQVDLNKCKKE